MEYYSLLITNLVEARLQKGYFRCSKVWSSRWFLNENHVNCMIRVTDNQMLYEPVEMMNYLNITIAIQNESIALTCIKAWNSHSCVITATISFLSNSLLFPFPSPHEWPLYSLQYPPPPSLAISHLSQHLIISLCYVLQRFLKISLYHICLIPPPQWIIFSQQCSSTMTIQYTSWS